MEKENSTKIKSNVGAPNLIRCDNNQSQIIEEHTKLSAHVDDKHNSCIQEKISLENYNHPPRTKMAADFNPLEMSSIHKNNESDEFFDKDFPNSTLCGLADPSENLYKHPKAITINIFNGNSSKRDN